MNTNQTETARAVLPTRFGRFQIRIFADNAGHETEPFVLIPEQYLERLEAEPQSHIPLVRVHSECLTGECLGSLRCECGPQLHEALRRVQDEGGVVVYLRQEGRGIGLTDKIRAYALQDAGLDTYEANTALGLAPDGRSYRAAAGILLELGLTHVRLLTNNPDKINGLEQGGITVTERVPLIMETTPENRAYLHAKHHRFGQLLEENNEYTGN